MEKIKIKKTNKKIIVKKKTPKKRTQVSSQKTTPKNTSPKSFISDDELIEKYIESMDSKTKLAFEIAKDHLETSFNIEKSLGFIKFKQQYQKI
jgi:hypothetical protein